jgi:hypothetical protein
VVKASTKLLLREPWFKDIWIDALEVCKNAIEDGDDDLEVFEVCLL